MIKLKVFILAVILFHCIKDKSFYLLQTQPYKGVGHFQNISHNVKLHPDNNTKETEKAHIKDKINKDKCACG